MNTVQPEMQETGAGDVPPVIHLSRFQARDSSQILFLPRARLSGAIITHSPPPYSGRAEWLIDSSHRKTFTWSGGDSRLPPHIPMPQNDGKSIFQVR